ncbi:hypothetical protein KR018_012593 [Drosophila ironensis]|nr:hypothetical protein KR018_012593 [Drosophila ironensis]
MTEENPSLLEQRERIDNAMINAIDDLDRDYLRKLQVRMHVCATNCCTDSDASAEAVQRCVDRCQLPLTRARSYVQQELSDFEGRLEACIQKCRVNGSAPSSSAAAAASASFAGADCHLERCSIECIDGHVALLPQMLRAMRATLEKGF